METTEQRLNPSLAPKMCLARINRPQWASAAANPAEIPTSLAHQPSSGPAARPSSCLRFSARIGRPAGRTDLRGSNSIQSEGIGTENSKSMRCSRINRNCSMKSARTYSACVLFALNRPSVWGQVVVAKGGEDVASCLNDNAPFVSIRSSDHVSFANSQQDRQSFSPRVAT